MTGGWTPFPARPADVTILYLCACIGIGGLVRCLLKNLKFGKVRFPYSAGLLIVGILFGVISLTSQTMRETSGVILKLAPMDLMAILFPPFIFKTAFQVDIHILLKSCGQIMAISTVGFMFVCMATGFFMMLVIGNDWSTTSAIVFGLVTSVTDTKDTSKFLGQFKNLGILLAGEEIMISTSSLFFYHIIVLSEIGYLATQPASLTFFKMIMPIAIGCVSGKLFIYFLSWDQCDFLTHISFSLSVSYTMFYSMQAFLGVSGIVTLTVFGMIICCNKQHITAELEHSLIEFWELLYTLSNYVLYIEAGLLLVQTCSLYGEESDIACIVITYLVCLVSRSLMLLCLSPLLSRIGYGFHWKDGVVVVWGALRGTGSLLLASCLHIQPPAILGNFSKKAVMYVVGLILMSLFLNGSTLGATVEILGLTKISIAKISNMNNIMQYIILARDRTINMLKMNRLFADADWDTVRAATKIVHPYRVAFNESAYFKQEGDTGEDGDLLGQRVLRCPDCHRDVETEPTPKELQEMIKEAQLRVLKAKKTIVQVSYWRQFEQGVLTKEGNQVLVDAVENALDKDVKLMDIDSIKNTWKPKGCMVYIRNKLVKMMPKKQPKLETQPPEKRWRLCCYTLVNSIWWEYIIFLIVVFNAVSLILDLVSRPTFELVAEIILIIFSSAGFSFLITVIVIHILGMGCHNYLRNIWNLVDIMAASFSLFYLFYVFKHYWSTQEEKNQVHAILIPLSCTRCIQMIRFLRIFGVVRASIPKIVAYLDKKIDVQLAFGYDVGKGFVTGEDEVLKLLPRIVDNAEISKEIKVKMEADRLEVTKEIGILQRNRPAIAITVKTRQSMAAALHVMKEAVGELKDGGLLDDEDFRKLCQVLEERKKIIRKRYLSISPCAPGVLLRQVTWLVGDDESANFLLTHSLMVNLNYEEILIRANDYPQGIYIIISGLVRTIYDPHTISEKLDELEKKGALPNVDYPTNISFREKQEDYIVSGNVIGELGILTGRSYDSTVICESSVQAYFISIDAMRFIMRSTACGYLGIELRMWKAVAVRIASIILTTVSAYQSWSQEKIQYHLERSFVPNLSSVKEIEIDEFMEAVLLIEGKAFDVNKHPYSGPVYIPRAVQKLTFYRSESHLASIDEFVEPRLLIIPTEDLDEQDIMDYAETFASAAEGEQLSLKSSRCTGHNVPSGFSKSSNDKPSKKSYWQRTKRNVFGFKKIDKLRPGGPKPWRSFSSSTMAHSGSRVIQITESTATDQQQMGQTPENTTAGPSNGPENKETRLKQNSDNSRLKSLEAKPVLLQTHRKRAIRIEEDQTEEQIEEEVSITEVVDEEDYSVLHDPPKMVSKKIQTPDSRESSVDVESPYPPGTRYRLSYIDYESYYPAILNLELDQPRPSRQSDAPRFSTQSHGFRRSTQGPVPKLKKEISKGCEIKHPPEILYPTVSEVSRGDLADKDDVKDHETDTRGKGSSSSLKSKNNKSKKS